MRMIKLLLLLCVLSATRAAKEKVTGKDNNNLEDGESSMSWPLMLMMLGYGGAGQSDLMLPSLFET